MMKIQSTILIIIALILSWQPAKSQDNCLSTLKEAKQLYEQGLIDEIPKILSSCMQSGFTRAQRIEAYKLIILTYLFDDNQFEAEKSMDDFLHKFPEYEVMPSDPVEFVYLLESYKTSSLYSINVYFGPNISNRRISESYTALDQNQTSLSDNSGTGYQMGIGLSRNLWKSLNANIDAIYTIHKYSYTRQSSIEVNTDNSKTVKLLAKEKTNIISFPASLTYDFGKGNLNYLVRLGGEFGILNKSSLSLERSYDIVSISENNYDILKHRDKYYYAVIAGAGLEYKVPRGYLVLDIRYHLGLNKMVISKERYSDPVLWTKYYYVDDDFYLNYLSLNIGYYFSIYQSRKKKD